MDEIVAQVSEKTGLSEEHSRMAVQMVIDWVKGKLPEGVRGHVDTALSGGSVGDSIADAVTSALGGMFGGD